jgi:hypothetical protein
MKEILIFHTLLGQFLNPSDRTKKMARAAKSDKPADDGSAPKKVNGLTKPMVLSPALAAIVGAKKDEKLARDGSHER